MPFPFRSHNEEIALTYHNVDIYPLLGVRNIDGTRWHEKKEWIVGLCRDPIQATGHHNSQEPSELKITVNDLQAPHTALNSSYGFWRVMYSGTTPARPGPRRRIAPVVRFCPVVRVGGIEFAILPLDGAGRVYRDKIWLSPADVQKCLDAAMEEMLGENGGEPVSELTGRGTVVKPRTTLEEHYPYVDDTMFPRVNFEWKITHLTKGQLDPQVQRWRHGVFGSKEAYDDRLVEFLDYLERHKLPDPLEGERSYIPFRPALQLNDEDMGTSQEYQGQLKRRSGQMSDSEESSPSSKRRSYTSQSSMASSLMAPSPTLGRGGGGLPRHEQYYPPTASRGAQGYQAEYLAPPPFRSPSRFQSMPPPEAPPMMAQTSQPQYSNLAYLASSALAQSDSSGPSTPQSSHLARLARLALGQPGSPGASSGVSGDTARTTGQYTQSGGDYQVLPSVWSGYGTSQPPSTTGGSQYGGTSVPPAPTQYQTSQSVGRGYQTGPPASMPSTVQMARDVFQYMEPQPGSSSGGRGHQTSLPPSSSAVSTTEVDAMQFQVTSADSSDDPDWWKQAGEEMRSTEPLEPFRETRSGHRGHHGRRSGSRHGWSHRR